MTAVLRDALMPNLVQTREGGPALVHCGSLRQHRARVQQRPRDRAGHALGDYAITEAGFGFDLGGEKFLDIKCRQMGVWPRAVVLVVTLRALKMHGGAPVKLAGDAERASALGRASRTSRSTWRTPRDLRAPALVAINVFPNDTADELRRGREGGGQAAAHASRAARASPWAARARSSSRSVVGEVVDATDALPPRPRFVYELERRGRGEDPQDCRTPSTARAT